MIIYKNRLGMRLYIDYDIRTKKKRMLILYGKGLFGVHRI